LSAILLGLLHLFTSYTGGASLIQLLGVTLVPGFGFGYLVGRMGSLWGAVLAHAMATCSTG
jgi:membrane protease YdiL (CAAX protease family)